MTNKEIIKNLKKLVEEWPQNIELVKLENHEDYVVNMLDVRQFLDDLNYYLDLSIYKPPVVPIVVNYIVATQEQWHYCNTEEEALALKEELKGLNIESIVMKDVKVLPESEDIEIE